MPNSDTERLLEEMVRLFEADDWTHWASFFARALALYRAGDLAECGRHILSGSGGMGSLNDVILGQGRGADGQFEWKPGHEAANARYQAVLASLYEFAQQAERGRAAP